MFTGFEANLSSCWLAATSPRFFRESKNKSTIEQIILSKICVDLENIIRINLTSFQKHVSLRVVINLLFGTVRIFQYQVKLLFGSIQHLVSHGAVRCNESSKVSRKRRRALLNLTSPTKQNHNLSEIFSQNIMTQLSNVLDLNEEERKILDSDETCQPSNQHCIPDICPPAEFRADLFNREDFDDFGGYCSEIVDHFSLPTSSRKRRNTDTDYEDESDCTEIFKIPTACKPIFDHPAATPRKRLVYSSCNDCEETFKENIVISSTPKSNHNKAMQCSNEAMNYDSSQQLTYQHRRRLKRKATLKLDSNIKIQEKKFIDQFYYASTLRNIAPRDDIVTLFETKKVNSIKLMSTPCKSLMSHFLLLGFKRNLIMKRRENDVYILEEVLGTNMLDQILEVSTRCPADKKRKHVRSSLDNLSTCFENTEPASKKSKQTPKDMVDSDIAGCMIIEKIKPTIHSTWAGENELSLQNRHGVILKLLNQLWQEKAYPINMNTIKSHKYHRKEMALTFLMIIELNAKRYIELIKNPTTNEIVHIKKKHPSRQTA